MSEPTLKECIFAVGFDSGRLNIYGRPLVAALSFVTRERDAWRAQAESGRMPEWLESPLMAQRDAAFERADKAEHERDEARTGAERAQASWAEEHERRQVAEAEVARLKAQVLSLKHDVHILERDPRFD